MSIYSDVIRIKTIGTTKEEKDTKGAH